MLGRQRIAMVVAEFVGTYVLATAMLAMLVRTDFEFFSAAAGAVVYGLMWLVLGSTGSVSLNPAVTIGLWTVRKVSTVHAVVAIVAQMLAGLVAWRLGQYFLNQALSKTAAGGLDWRVLIAEAVGTLVFTFGVAAAVTKELDNAKRALVVALSLFAGVLVASLASNGLLNPAVDLASRTWSWAYVVGPIVGGIVGMNFYSLLYAGKSSTTSKKKK